MYDFLLLINTNLLPILHRFAEIQPLICPKLLHLTTPLAFNPPVQGLPTSYHRKRYMLLKTRNSGLHFCWRKFSYTFNHFYAVHTQSYQIRWNNAK